MTPIEELYLQAEADLSAGAYEKALETYQRIPDTGLSPAQKIRRADVMGFLWVRLGEPDKAKDLYRETVAWLTSAVPERQDDLGRMLNNLGRLNMPENPKAAIGCFDRSIKLYEDLAASHPDFAVHLANTRLARAEAYSAQAKHWFAKRDYKKAIELYTQTDPGEFRDSIAFAHYQLGTAYQEEFNAYDARNQYSRALKLYQEAAERNPRKYRPSLAATYNNLAQAHQALEDYDKAEKALLASMEIYRRLSGSEPEYTAFLAATHTHLAILRSEHKSDTEGALEVLRQAVEIYRDLKSKNPEQFTHYWATALHNTGAILAAAQKWQEAVVYFREALEARRELTERQPGLFAADLCATALNLAECHLNQIDSSGQWEFRDQALEVLEETEPRLRDLPDQPLTRSMKADYDELLTRLRNLKQGDVLSQSARRKTRSLEDEIDGTLDLDEKIHYQHQILNCWVEVCEWGGSTENQTLERVRALSNLAWLYLRKGMTSQARAYLEDALAVRPGFEPALCNLAHCDLLAGNREAASTRYRALWANLQNDGKTYGEVINRDLLQLVQAGVLSSDDLPASAIAHPVQEE